MSDRQILSAADMDRTLTRVAHEILERNPDALPALIGIRRRGEFLAKRVLEKMREILAAAKDIKKPGVLQMGILDINLYRDDLTRVAEQPVIRETVIGFDINDRVVVLVDDVLYTGRTVRSALDALKDLGRPKAIQLAVLVDRGHRELPIRADFVGKNVPTQKDEVIHVHMTEVDGDDRVMLERHGAPQ